VTLLVAWLRRDTLGGMAEATDEQTKDVHCRYVKPPLLLWGLNNTHTG